MAPSTAPLASPTTSAAATKCRRWRRRSTGAREVRLRLVDLPRLGEERGELGELALLPGDLGLEDGVAAASASTSSR